MGESEWERERELEKKNKGEKVKEYFKDKDILRDRMRSRKGDLQISRQVDHQIGAQKNKFLETYRKGMAKNF